MQKYLVATTESFSGKGIPDEVQAFLDKYPDCYIILDESSKIKTSVAKSFKNKSNRTKNIQRLNKYGHRSILTGTFMSKTPINAYDQMEFLKDGYWEEGMFTFAPKYEVQVTLKNVRGTPRVKISEKMYSDFHRRLKRALNESNNKLTAVMNGIFLSHGLSREDALHILKNEKYTPFKNVEDLWKRIGKDALVVTKEDALDLPELITKTISFELPSKTRKLYKELVDLNFTDNITLSAQIELYLRCQELCNGFEPIREVGEKVVELEELEENPKVEAIREVLEEIDFDKEQALIWASRTHMIEKLGGVLEDLEIPYMKLYGKTTEIDKKIMKEKFLSGEIRVILGNQASGGFGLDYLKKANYALYACCDYSVETRKQSQDRIYRNGITDKKLVIDFVAKNTVEEKVMRSLQLGEELLSSGNVTKETYYKE